MSLSEADLDPLQCLEEDLELRRLDGFASQHIDLKTAQIEQNQVSHVVATFVYTYRPSLSHAMHGMGRM